MNPATRREISIETKPVPLINRWRNFGTKRSFLEFDIHWLEREREREINSDDLFEKSEGGWEALGEQGCTRELERWMHPRFLHLRNRFLEPWFARRNGRVRRSLSLDIVWTRNVKIIVSHGARETQPSVSFILGPGQWAWTKKGILTRWWVNDSLNDPSYE